MRLLLYKAFLRNAALSWDAVSLGILYASFATNRGFANPSVKTLAEVTGWTHAHIKAARWELVEAGALERYPNGPQTIYRVTALISPVMESPSSPAGERTDSPKSALAAVPPMRARRK